MSQAPNSQALLIELCTEELPPKSLSKLSHSFTSTLLEVLMQNELAAKDCDYKSFASPRRLGILVNSVKSQQPDRSQLRKGPALQAAFDPDGQPTKAASGFARSCGVEVSDLERTETKQGTWLTFTQKVKGKDVTEIAQEALDLAIKNLPIPKRMRWGSSSTEFARPVHKLLALFGDKPVALNAFGLTASNATYGHRFHCSSAIQISSAVAYESELRDKGKVIADFESRKTQIKQDAKSLAAKKNCQVILDEDLLDEVTGLVEWPVTVMGEFDPRFLDIPEEALVASMKDHQKYFHLVDSDNRLQPNFVTVSNIQSIEPERVVKGNERVLRARLSDAMFFWDQDKSQKLSARQPQLEDVLFHLKLGSVADKVKRIGAVAQYIGEQTGASLENINRAATLCKNDLVSDMVGEFPSLQGTMGHYYALNDTESKGVADAIEQHYWPKFAGDKLPTSPEATALAMADRVDTLVGIFATGEKPTGVKDPYALRRASLGIIRMLVDNEIDISLQDLLSQSINAYKLTEQASVEPDQTTQSEITQFILDRLRAFYLAQDFSANEFNAVAACHPARASDFDQRIRAINTFYCENEEDAKSLAAANKRIANILRKTDYQLPDFKLSLATEKAEHQLATELAKLSDAAHIEFGNKDYSKGLALLAGLRCHVDHFFDEIMVMDEDVEKRNNRLALLQNLRALFMQVADISHLVIEK